MFTKTIELYMFISQRCLGINDILPVRHLAQYLEYCKFPIKIIINIVSWKYSMAVKRMPFQDRLLEFKFLKKKKKKELYTYQLNNRGQVI